MDIKTLNSLVAIADYGSFAEAARAVGLSTSRVSLQIQALEAELGFGLFDRRTRPPRITDAGRRFVARARALLLQWDELTQAGEGQARRGLMRIGAVHTTVAGIVPAALRLLRDRQPELHVHLSTGLSHELEEALRIGQLDGVIVTEPDTVTAGHRFHAFAEDELVVIAHASAAGTTDREVLSGNPYVRFSRHARVARVIELALARREIAVNSFMEIGTFDAVVSLVEHGLGVSIVPVIAASTLPPAIRVIPFGSPPLKRRLGIIESAQNPRTHLVAALLEALTEVVTARASGSSPLRRLSAVDLSPVAKPRRTRRRPASDGR
ncbi:MAG: LysR family transcriptional regulator [Burkholderiaceae bacterium]|nr:LysR family transcriptional regulator [Burkholderiaceae bacterium]